MGRAAGWGSGPVEAAGQASLRSLSKAWKQGRSEPTAQMAVGRAQAGPSPPQAGPGGDQDPGSRARAGPCQVGPGECGVESSFDLRRGRPSQGASPLLQI